MSETVFASPPAAPTNPISDVSVGTVQARVVTFGANRLQVLVNNQWWDVDGVALAEVFTSDPRYAGRVTFTKLSSISPAAIGASTSSAALPAGQITGSLRSTAPTQTTSAAAATTGSAPAAS